MNVRFFGGTRAQYDSLPTPRNPLGLYFCADTNELFWGDRLISDGVRVVPTYNDLPELASAADGIVYYVTQTRNGYTIAPDRTKWLQTVYAPATDAYEVPESEIYNTVTTVGAVRDIEAKIYDVINDRLSSSTVSTVPFTTSNIVTKALGGFTVGEDVKDLTIAQLFTKLLGLTSGASPDEPGTPNEPVNPDTPVDPGTSRDEIVADIITNNTPMYSVNANDKIVALSYGGIINYTEAEAEELPSQSGFYQITDDSGNVVESGYQELTVNNPDVPYIIALPIGIDFNSMVAVQTFDTLESKWKTDSLEMSGDYAEISALCDELSIDISHINTDLYTLWADLEAGPSGKIHRFIIID